MTDLYQRHGGEPAPLPSIAFDERNFAYTPPYADEDLAMLGFSLTPAQPDFDPATQVVEWQDGAWAVSDIPPPPPFILTPADIDAERDRRINGGFRFGATEFQTRPADRENILGAVSLATLAITLGGKKTGDLRWHGGEADFAWIAADNSLVTMDAPTVIAFGQAAAEHKSAHTFAARALKDAEAIPADFADDKHWPRG